MARQLIICPHCRAKKTLSPSASAEISNTAAYVLFMCDNCDLPVVLLVAANRPRLEYRRFRDAYYEDQSFEKSGWQVIDSWPKPQFRKGTAPKGLPEGIELLLEQSHEAGSKGGYDLAIMGYQRILKMAKSIVSPEFKRNTHAWLMSLIEAGHLTANLKSWANSVRVRSEIEGATATEAEEFASFLDAVLLQIFGIRSSIARFRRGAA